MTLIGIRKKDAVPVLSVFMFDPTTLDLQDSYTQELFINNSGIKENTFASRISA